MQNIQKSVYVMFTSPHLISVANSFGANRVIYAGVMDSKSPKWVNPTTWLTSSFSNVS